MGRGRKTLRIVALGSLSIVLLIPFLIGAAWLHAAVVLALAEREGVYASPEQGMRALIAHRWSDVERIEIEYAGPNERDGSKPHVWFVSARVWLQGQARYRYPRSFFLRVEPRNGAVEPGRNLQEILNHILIRRTRRHIRTYYPDAWFDLEVHSMVYGYPLNKKGESWGVCGRQSRPHTPQPPIIEKIRVRLDGTDKMSES